MRGRVMGFLHAAFSFAYIVSPASSAYLLNTGGVFAVNSTAAAVFVSLAFLWTASRGVPLMGRQKEKSS